MVEARLVSSDELSLSDAGRHFVSVKKKKDERKFNIEKKGAIKTVRVAVKPSSRSKAIVHRRMRDKTVKAPAVRKAVSGELASQLATALFTEIDSHKIYPLLAKRRRYQGITVLQFILTPQGKVRHLRRIKSSGFELLDNAAEQAVLQSQPFFSAVKFLSHAQLIRVPIKFGLA